MRTDKTWLPESARRPARSGSRRIWLVVLSIIVLSTAVAGPVLLRRSMLQQADEQLAAASARHAAVVGDNDHDTDDDFVEMVGPAAGTIGAVIRSGQVQSIQIIGRQKIDDKAEAALATLPPSGPTRSVNLSGLGPYRVSARPGPSQSVLVVGLPIKHIARILQLLVTIEGVVVLLLLGLTAAWLMTATEHHRHRLPAELEDAVQTRFRALVAEASHELRTPAAVIRSYAELAERSSNNLPPDVDHALRRIGYESSRMGYMVDDLLALSRCEAGVPGPMAEVDITGVLFDTVGDARVTASTHRWRLVVPAQPVVVSGHEGWLRQAVTNLLTNASVHTPAGSQVDIRLGEENGFCVVSVADDGPGIEPELLNRVFERFARCRQAELRPTGAGLGLTLVRQIALAHNGSVGVRSETGRTEFVLRLPMGSRSATVPASGAGATV